VTSIADGTAADFYPHFGFEQIDRKTYPRLLRSEGLKTACPTKRYGDEVSSVWEPGMNE